MPSNIEKYRSDLKSLIERGELLRIAMDYECDPKGLRDALASKLSDKKKAEEYLKKLPSFVEGYQPWYSEAKALVRQIIPDRLDDFVVLYERPKTRKQINYGNYVVYDYLQQLQVTRGTEVLVESSAAIPQFRQQLNIVKSAQARFESSLFDIRQLIMADIFDSEIDVARELAKHGFLRAAGAVAGVVLEKHLGQVCDNRSIKLTKKHPAISDLNDALRSSSVIDTAQWRYIQHLADIRNLCDHDKKKEPTASQLSDLLDGVAKVVKTVL